jgi:hypothetical protein
VISLLQGEAAHAIVKQLYGMTNKTNATGQIAKRYLRQVRAHHAQTAAEVAAAKTLETTITPPPSPHLHLVSGSQPQDGLEFAPLDKHYYISASNSHPINIPTFLSENIEDPAKKVSKCDHSMFIVLNSVQCFLPKLQAHILSQILCTELDGDEALSFTDEDLNSVRILGNRIYSTKTVTVNYTTYDVRQDSDVVNPSAHADVLVPSPKTGPSNHPFWYARVLGVFHAKVLTLNGPAGNRPPKHMEFLWVRWYGLIEGHLSGHEHARLPMLSFLPDTDALAFGFLDPAQIIRGCHIIPAFRHGHTADLLKFKGQSAARSPGEHKDWTNYYANM